MDDELGPETRRFAAVPEESACFFVQYTKSEGWDRAAFDDAISLDDARKVASARRTLGYRTRIVESKTGIEVIEVP